MLPGHPDNNLCSEYTRCHFEKAAMTDPIAMLLSEAPVGMLRFNLGLRS